MTLQTQLASLETSGLVNLAQAEPDLEYLFKHALVQEASYESLLKQDRRQIHAAVAQTLESLYVNRLDEIYTVLAFHFNRAEDWDKTLTYAQSAADQAKQQYANTEALMAYDLALQALTKIETQNPTPEAQRQYREQYFSLLSERHGVATRIGRFDQAKANLEEMARLARDMEDDSRLADALNGLGFFYVNTGSGDPKPPLEEALAIKRRRGDLRGQADSLNNLGSLYFSLSGVEQGLSALEEAHDLYQTLNDHDGLARSEWTLGTITYELIGNYNRALQHLTRALTLCRENHNRALECGSLMMLGALYARTGAHAQAHSYLTQTLDLARQIGDRPAEGWALLYSSWSDRETGQLTEALTHAQQALTIAEELGTNNLIWYAMNALASLALTTGDVPEAHRYATQLHAIGQLATVWTEIKIRSAALLAYTLTLSGQVEDGIAQAQATFQKINAQNGQGVSEVHAVYYYCYLTLHASDAPTAYAALQKAHSVVQAQANSIADPVWRSQFLNNIALNRSIVKSWKNSQPSAP
jgi:tetratricopeptide (TPR) repeat protein